MVNDVIESSQEADCIKLSKQKHQLIIDLRDFNYKEIYKHDDILKWRKHGEKMLKNLFDYLLDLYNKNGLKVEKYRSKYSNKVDRYFSNYLEKIKDFYKKTECPPNKVVVDYISGMTDEFALRNMKYMSVPEPLNFNKP